jgi:hypothetical protein
MRQLNGVYTQAYNKRHGLVGHVLQGRYKAILVEKGPHLLNLCRYIVQNPVVAGLAPAVEDWLWSSYRATAGLAAAPEWLTDAWLLGQFAESEARARSLYREFVAREHAVQPWNALSGRVILGSEEFTRSLDPLVQDKKLQLEIPRPQRLVTRPALSTLLTPGNTSTKHLRGLAMYSACIEFGYAMKDIADHLGIHYATVSRAVKKIEIKMSDCKT